MASPHLGFASFATAIGVHPVAGYTDLSPRSGYLRGNHVHREPHPLLPANALD
jgi:hypothetical protein